MANSRSVLLLFALLGNGPLTDGAKETSVWETQDKGLPSRGEKNHEFLRKVTKTCDKNEIFYTLPHLNSFIIQRRQISLKNCPLGNHGSSGHLI